MRAGLQPLELKSLTKGQNIAKGSFGEVYVGKYKDETVAIKILTDTSSADGSKLSDDLLYEACMLQRAGGLGVLELKAVDSKHMVTEYMPNHSVEHELKKADDNKEDSIFHPNNESNLDNTGLKDPVLLQKVRIARDVAFALARLHAKGILHLDIAARNILLDGRKRPKIGDFGCAAMESDMLEQFNVRKKMIDDYVGSDEDFETDCEMALNDLAPVDDNAKRKFKMHIHQQRPIAFMPHWVVCGGPKSNPLIDRYADIYAFGCFMYELSQHKVPHQGISKVQILEMKSVGQGNPIFPPDVHIKYREIAELCWREHGADPVISMGDIANKLAELHRSLLTNLYKEDEDYLELLNVSQAEQSQAERTPASAGGADEDGGGYASPEDTRKMMDEHLNDGGKSGKTMWAARNDRSENAGGRPQVIDETKIRLKFPPNMVYDKCEMLLDYEDNGKTKTKFNNALHSAFQFRDHTTIAYYLQRIVLENSSSQITAVTDCMDYLAKLSRDEHASTDMEDNWCKLCEIILDVTHKATKTNTREGIDLDENYKQQVISQALEALSGLLFGKRMIPGTSVVDDVSIAVISALSTYLDDKLMIERAAKTISSLLRLVGIALNAVRTRLYRGKVVGLMLDAMKRFPTDIPLQLACIQAIALFPVDFLIYPRCEMKKPSRNQSINSSPSKYTHGKAYGESKDSSTPYDDPPEENLDHGEKSASPDDNTSASAAYAAIWSEVFDIVVTIAQTVSSSRDEENGMELTRLQEGFLAVCLLRLFQICKNAEHDEDLIEKFLFSAKPGVIVWLVQMLRMFPDDFKIQEGSIGLLCHLIRTGGLVYVAEEDTEAVSHASVYNLLKQQDTGRANTLITLALSPITPAAVRLETLLKADVGLKQILSAMEKFSVDDTISVGINSSENGQALNISRGVYSQSKTVTRFDSRTFSKSNKPPPVPLNGDVSKLQQSSSPMSLLKPLMSFTNQQIHEFIIDAIGILINEMTFENPNLLSDENGEIISAVSLQTSVAMIIGFACNARKDIQTMIIRTRYNECILKAFSNFPGNVDLMRKGFHALYSTCRRNVQHQKILYELHILNHMFVALNKYQEQWMIVDGIVCALIGLLEPPESYNADDTTSFNALLSPSEAKRAKELLAEEQSNSISLRVAEELSMDKGAMMWLAIRVARFELDPECHPLLCNFFRLISAVTFWKPEMIAKWNTQFFDFEDTRFKHLWNELVQCMTVANDHGEGAKNVQAQNTVLSKHSSKSLVAFVLLPFALFKNDMSMMPPHVLAAGLAILTAAMRQTFVPSTSSLIEEHATFRIGDDLQFVAADDIRLDLYNVNMMMWCLEAAKRKEDDPVLIRYSLWIMLMFISQSPDGTSSSALDRTARPDRIASDLAIHGAIEWAIEVMKKYSDYYSLLALATTFLLWMERHGRFANRSIERLCEIRELLLLILSRRIDAYKPLYEEGYDTYLVGFTRNAFGQQSIHANKLLQVVEKHILEKMASRRMSTLPLSVKVVAVEKEEDENTHKPCYVFVMNVTLQKNGDLPDGEEEVVWRIARRFTKFCVLRRMMLKEFDHLIHSLARNDECFKIISMVKAHKFFTFFLVCAF